MYPILDTRVEVKLEKVSTSGLEIFHVQGNGNMEEIKDFSVEGNTVKFTHNDFSPFVFANRAKVDSSSSIATSYETSKAEKLDKGNKIYKARAKAPKTGETKGEGATVIALMIASLMVLSAVNRKTDKKKD